MATTTTTPNQEAVAHLARVLMAVKGYDQRSLAVAMGINEATLSRKLSGRAPISLGDKLAMARVLEADEGVFDLDPDAIEHKIEDAFDAVRRRSAHAA